MAVPSNYAALVTAIDAILTTYGLSLFQVFGGRSTQPSLRELISLRWKLFSMTTPANYATLIAEIDVVIESYGLSLQEVFGGRSTQPTLQELIDLRYELFEVGGSGGIDLTAPPTNIGTTTPVAVNSTIFTALPANNTSALIASGSSLTGSNAQSLVNLSQTWNTTGTPTAIFANITDTASNAASSLLDLQVGGMSRFNVRKSGTIDISNSGTAGVLLNDNSTSGIRANSGSGNIKIGSLNGFGLGVWNNFIAIHPSAGIDTCLYRDAANTLAQRNGVNSQTSRLYKSFTDVSNYTRAAWQFNANGIAHAGESAGTGDANISITLIPKGTGSVRTTGKIYPATDALAEQTATGILAGTGAPNNANGDNGDFYLRSDGGALTTIYQKRAGAWVGIV